MIGLLPVVFLTLSAQPVALTNARVYPGDGPVIPNGVVVVMDGKIMAIGPVGKVAIPNDAIVRDLVTNGWVSLVAWEGAEFFRWSAFKEWEPITVI